MGPSWSRESGFTHPRRRFRRLGLLTRHGLICSMSVYEGKPEPHLKVAALSGFMQMNVFHMTKLMKNLGSGGGFKKNNLLKSKCSTASSRRRSLVFLTRRCWLLWRSVTSGSWTSTTASWLCKGTFRQWRTFLTTRTFRTSEKCQGNCTPEGHHRSRCETGHTSTVEDRRADSGAREKGMENAAIPRRHPLGHRHGTPALERRISQSCGPPNGDEGMGAQDKVVLSAGAGVCSADRVAMAYNTDGGAMPI